jgi:hypothetical protein
MAECVCGRKTDLYLCSTCQNDLGELLIGLAQGTATNNLTGYSRPMAGWIEFLEDCTQGGTRLGMSARRSTERTSPMPVHLGPNGDFEESPSALLNDLNKLLIRWVEVVNTGTETLAIPGGS